MELSSAIDAGVANKGIRLPLAGSRIRGSVGEWNPQRLEVIPPWLHGPPQNTPIKSGDRGPAAQVLDRELGPVAVLEARCRHIQGKLLAEFLARRCWIACGFSRLGDYASERLGLKTRTVQEDAHIVTALASLPAIEAAFLSGRLRLTHVRLLISIATPETELMWLELARTRTTRQLERLIADAKRTAETSAAATSDASTDACAPDGTCSEADASTDACAQSRGGDEADANTDACAPGRTRGQANSSTDACVPGRTRGQADSGTDACAPGGTRGQADSGTDACAPGGTRGEADASTDACAPGRTRGEADASTDACVPSAANSLDGEDPSVTFTITCSRFGRRLWRGALEMASRELGSKVPAWQAVEAIAAETMSGVATEPFAHVATPNESVDSAKARSEAYINAFEVEYGASEGFRWLEPGAPSKLLPPELEQLLDGLGAEGLNALDAHELDRRLRIIRAAMQRIDWQLGSLLRTIADRKLYQQLGYASLRLYAEARLGICGTKAWALIRLERQCIAKSLALREAYRDGRVSWLGAFMLLSIIDEHTAAAWIARHEQVTLRRLGDDIHWALDRKDEPGGDPYPGPPPLDMNPLADTMKRLDPERVQMRARTGTDPLSFGYRIGARIRLSAPASVVALLEQAIEACRLPGESQWRGFERMLAYAFLTWSGKPRHRDKVFERDSWLCQVPGCSRRCDLEDHHIVFRSKGGGNEGENRVAVCAMHHRHFIHLGIIRARGTAPDNIYWEIGCRPGRGEPLFRTVGDRYVATNDAAA